MILFHINYVLPMWLYGSSVDLVFVALFDVNTLMWTMSPDGSI